MPPILAAIYVLAAVLWYELLRSALRGRILRRRGKEAGGVEEWEQAELAASEREAAEQEAAEAAEPDVARRLYYLARKAARAERDLAIQRANDATQRAVERIEDRYREIAADLDDEEAERLRRGRSRGS
jgi:biopolymer transport protein ExbB/TolQ